MISEFFFIYTVAILATPASAFIRFGCNLLVEERADPVVSPGQVSGHAHKIAGGSGFNFTMDYNQARASACSSCPIQEDFSNYWTPKLYYQYENGTFQSVPTVGDNMNDLNGGMTVYYLQRGPGALKAFPEGFRMLAGDSTKRSFGGDFASQAISFSCLGANQPETNGMPNYNCPGGLRAQVFFPSCWDGQNLDSSDHKSHMSYPDPATGAYNSGACPSSYPVQLISLFFEVLYDTNQFANMWYGNSQPFVFSNGDPTGYGFHGDFVNGWDVGVLQNVVDDCNDLSAQGVLDACGAITQFSGSEQSTCRQPSQINEKVAGYLPTLPGCNPVSPAPGPAPKATCSGQAQATIGGAANYFTDETANGWAYQGCASDGSTRTLADKMSLYMAGVGATMTVEWCLNFCQGYTYAGLEYAQECYCGNTLAADRAPQPGIFGSCNMKCNGNSTEFCGGPLALSLYQKCSGTDCQNVLFGGISPATGSSPSAGIVAPAGSSSSTIVAAQPAKSGPLSSSGYSAASSSSYANSAPAPAKSSSSPAGQNGVAPSVVSSSGSTKVAALASSTTSTSQGAVTVTVTVSSCPGYKN